MTREELRNNYGNEICELCCQEYFTNRAHPESLCEGQFCEDAEDSFAEENNIEVEDQNMEKIYKGEIQRLLPIFKAMAEGKTIQFATNDNSWIDIDGDEDGFSLQTLIDNTQSYRIKPEPKYRPFANAEECWTEMQKHQPFGWVKDRNGSKFVIENVDSRGFVEVYDEGTCNFKEVFENRTFADGVPFGVKVEGQL